jgi:hypothetical protein
MSKQNFNTEDLFKKFPGLINTANDKLTVITGNAEIALLDIAGKELEPLKKQLQVITALSEEIGIINGKIMGLITGLHCSSEGEG